MGQHFKEKRRWDRLWGWWSIRCGVWQANQVQGLLGNKIPGNWRSRGQTLVSEQTQTNGPALSRELGGIILVKATHLKSETAGQQKRREEFSQHTS
jgi:hypothetical protein